MTVLSRPKLGVIGYGTMAAAMITRWLHMGLLVTDDLSVSTRSGKSKSLTELGIPNQSNQEVLDQSEVVVLGIKPQQLHEVTDQLEFSAQHVVLSVLAGTPLETLARAVAPAQTVRLMPNLAVGLGVGVVAELGLEKCDSRHVSWIEEALGILGTHVPLNKEALFDGVTALAGSAPAFCFVMAQAMADAAVLEGVPRADSEALAAAVLEGAGAMLRTEAAAPETLKDRVASPKGTTISGLRALEAGGFRSAVIEAIAASAARSRELSEG